MSLENIREQVCRGIILRQDWDINTEIHPGNRVPSRESSEASSE